MNELNIDSGDEASLSIETLTGKVDGEPIYRGYWGKVLKSILETGAFPHRVQFGNLCSPLTEYFKRKLGALEYVQIVS